MSKKTGMNKKRLHRKVCSCKFTAEKKVPATVWILQRKLKHLRRQNHSLEAELKSVKEKNIELAKSVQIEKCEQSRLKDEYYTLNSRYHNLSVNYNSTKEELIRTHQLITTLEDDNRLAFSHLLKAAESITISKSRIGEHFSFTQSKFQKDKEDNDVSVHNSHSPIKDAQNLKCGVPVKQRVGPMIKGYPITKPKIMLKRISVPVQQELDVEETENGDTLNDTTAIPPLMPINEDEEESDVSGPKLLPAQRRTRFRFQLHSVRNGDLEETDSGDTFNDTTDIPPLTPVAEEEEEESVVSSPKLAETSRPRAGFRFRLHPIRNDEKNNSPSNSNNRESASVVFTCETVGENIHCFKEPVVRLHDVSQMLIVENTAVFEVNGPNSSFRIIETDKTGEEKENKEERMKGSGKESKAEGKSDSSQNRSLKRPSEDPLEGCSWMFNSCRRKYSDKKRRSHTKRKLYFEGRPTYSSDDSLSDDENFEEPSNNHMSVPQVCEENETVNVAAPSDIEIVHNKLSESVPQESFSLCPYYDPTNPNHNSDRKLCNACETCVTLQITTRSRLEVCKNTVECEDRVSVEPDSSESCTLGYLKDLNSWVCSNSNNKMLEEIATLPCKTHSLTCEVNSFRISNVVHTSTPELNDKSQTKVVLPNVILQRLEPELTSCESVYADDTIDLNRDVKLKTSSEVCESVDSAQSDTSGKPVRRSERIAAKDGKCHCCKVVLPPQNTSQHQSKRMSRSGKRSANNSESSEELMTTEARPRRNVKKVNYKTVSLRKKLRRQ